MVIMSKRNKDKKTKDFGDQLDDFENLSEKDIDKRRKYMEEHPDEFRKGSNINKFSGIGITEQRCGACNNLHILLVGSDKTNQELCSNCFANLEGVQEASKHMSRMNEYQRELWETPLPDNFREIVKNRAIKKELQLTSDSLENSDGTLLIDHLIGKINEYFHDKFESFDQITTEEGDKVFEIINKEMIDYPELTPTVKNKMIDMVRRDIDGTIEKHNNLIQNETTHTDRLLDVVKSQVKPQYFEKIKKIIELWIQDNEKPANEITDAEVMSATDGAIHNVEKHKESPNGYCKECDEYYNSGEIKTKLSDALEILTESVNNFSTTASKKHQDLAEERGEIPNNEQLTAEIQTYKIKLDKRFLNTPQKEVDDFLESVKTENQKISEERKRVRELKKQQFKMKDWAEARSLVRKKNLYTHTDYENWTKTDDFPEDMHERPDLFYKEWKDLQGRTEGEKWKIFLGSVGRLYNFRKDKKAHTHQNTKTILEEIQKRIDHYWLLDAGLLTNWFKLMGLFHHRDPGVRAFVKQFVESEKTPEGKKELQIALSKTIFNLQIGHFPKGVNSTPLAPTAKTYLDRSRAEKTNYAKTALLEKIPAISVRFIIENTREIVPMTKDTRWWNLHIEFVKAMIWKQLFDPTREREELEAITLEGKNGNAFHDEVLSRFWDEYNGVKGIKTWKDDYSFSIAGVQKQPMLNQLYTGYMMRKLNGFCNFGDPGIGKTNAAFIATRLPKVKFILIIAPFNITKQWVAGLHNIYPHSFISEGKEVFKDWAKGSYDKYYHVINYEKFARDQGELVNQLAQFEIGFVVIDESHHTKIRTPSTISNTRHNIEKLLDKLRVQNRKLKCLMLSATPVINNISEGKSLLEMVTGTKYPDLKTTNNLGNATELHAEFVPFSVRYIKNYANIKQEHKDPVFVDADVPTFLSKDQVRKLSWLDYEHIATKARIPEIVKKLKKKTIIYTDFVSGNPLLGKPILELLKDAVEKEGYSVGFFTGTEIKPGIGGKGGLEDWSNCKVVNGKKVPFNPFVNGNLDVLIASSSLSEGIDELQYVCSNMILNGLVWTYAEFKQLIGRLVREGQKDHTVTIHMILAKINGYDYDLKIKLNRMEIKKILGNCVTDGTLPNMDKFPNTKKELKNMIDHILKDQESTIKVPIKQKEKPHD